MQNKYDSWLHVARITKTDLTLSKIDDQPANEPLPKPLKNEIRNYLPNNKELKETSYCASSLPTRTDDLGDHVRVLLSPQWNNEFAQDFENALAFFGRGSETTTLFSTGTFTTQSLWTVSQGILTTRAPGGMNTTIEMSRAYQGRTFLVIARWTWGR